MKRALITGISGQDGHYLSRLLLERGYAVTGVSRHATSSVAAAGLHLIDGDVRDAELLPRLFRDAHFDEVYNLAGESFGPASWDDPAAAADVLGTAVIRILELVRNSPGTRFFQASSSELFGLASESPQSESTPFAPITPYGAAKLMAHAAVSAYRQRYGVFACCGILFNHESPLRRPGFVTRKVTRAAASIKLGLGTQLHLGNLDARRDWSFAGDVVEAMWRMLQSETADDFVIASGGAHSVRELCDCAFRRVGLDYRRYVVSDPSLVRGHEFDRVGNRAKITRVLGWEPRVSFEELIAMMVDSDLTDLARGAC